MSVKGVRGRMPRIEYWLRGRAAAVSWRGGGRRREDWEPFRDRVVPGDCLSAYLNHRLCQWNNLCVIFHSPSHFNKVNTSDARAFAPASFPDQCSTSTCTTAIVSMISMRANRGVMFGAGPF